MFPLMPGLRGKSRKSAKWGDEPILKFLNCDVVLSRDVSRLSKAETAEGSK